MRSESRGPRSRTTAATKNVHSAEWGGKSTARNGTPGVSRAGDASPKVLVDKTITGCYGNGRNDQNPGREKVMLPAPLPLDYLKHADPSDRFRRSRIRSGGTRVRRDPRQHGREVMPA
jgi:hypothetical protein